MNKKEFLDLLRRSLEGEVDNRILEQNINYYSEYISSHSVKSEEEVIEEIGDPRLIAKTIIDTERLPYEEANRRNDYGNYNNKGDYDRYTEENNNRRDSNKVYHIKGYHLLIFAIIVIFIFFILIRIGWLLLRLLSVFFVPIILIGLLWSMFRKR